TGSLEGIRLLQLDENSIKKVSAETKDEKSLKLNNNITSSRILIVEDGLDNQRLISFLLKKEGMQVELADNGKIGYEQAMAAAESGQPYDFILMDCQMPVMDGYTATEIIRNKSTNQNIKTPIIALTANAFREVKEKCFEYGMDDFATKPIKQEDLKNVLNRFLNK
ncbi:MAG: response regulator, partial [Bdellovibrionales bacterium]|nr:response regulator [Bdellovibrionales bacterium]